MPAMLDCRGMSCPKPVLNVAMKARTLEAGSTLKVYADCTTFATDIEKWCKDSGTVLLSVVDHGGYEVATLRME